VQKNAWGGAKLKQVGTQKNAPAGATLPYYHAQISRKQLTFL
jgi:hypothetical protein